MKLTIVDGPIPAVKAVGELDEFGASQLRTAVDRAYPPGQRFLALDLTDVDYLDSGGLRTILDCHREVRYRGGVMGIAVRHGALRDLIARCGLAFQPEVRFFDNLDDCALALDEL